MMTVDKDEPSPLEIGTVIGQIQERRVVEGRVGLLVDMEMPVLVVDGLGRSRGDPREKGRVREVQAGFRDTKVFGNS